MNFSEIVVQTVVSLPFGENAYLVHRKDVVDAFLIDPGTEPAKILEVIEEEKLTLTAILLTHGHYDHIAGIDAIRDRWPECKVCVGKEDGEKLTDPQKNLSGQFGLGMKVSEADIFLQGGETLEIAGIPIEVRHTPGHSRGHVVYLISAEPKSLLFSGDVIFERSIGRSDFFDGDSGRLLRSIREKVLTLPEDTIIYPGHGEPTTVGDERRGNPFLM